jgi:ABC-2 type transport system ATP-binding protein
MLQGMPGVDQVAPFGLTLHVVGRDRQALLRRSSSVAGQTGMSYMKAATSLEDVFIQFMGRSTDNMA